MDIQSYNMFTVLKYAINEILCVSVWNDNKVLFSPMFFQMFLNAIAVLYDYPGGGILSSWICFCTITCLLYGKTIFEM